MESYFEITLSLGVNIKMIEFSTGQYAVGGVIVSNIMAVAFFMISLGLPVFFLAYFLNKADDW